MKKQVVFGLLLALTLSGCSAGSPEAAQTQSAAPTQTVQVTEPEEPSAAPQAEASESPSPSMDVSSSPVPSVELTGLAAEGEFPRTFYFQSGAGAWGTELTIKTDYSFAGYYSDSDMGDSGDGYPNGTMYICKFSGTFTQPEKVNEYTYSMEIEMLELEGVPGEEYYEDGVRYIWSAPYGLDDAGEILVYLPGAPVAELPEEFVLWVNMSLRGETELPFCGLYNVNGTQGFSS